MISLHFNIPINEVEKKNYRDYRLMLFTVFNNASLLGDMMGMHKERMFKFQTDEDETSEFIQQIEDAKNRGLL